ncbi:MAG: glycine betaine ABC transporter substrate-binding protein [Candidatus Carbobacillus sp.]|nr:glycine betaine ABC transporter substrate-binding protein [Candidatus Carbobacillus sp.]
MNKRRFFVTFLIISLFTVLAACGSNNGGGTGTSEGTKAPEATTGSDGGANQAPQNGTLDLGQKTITIGVTPWTSTIPPTYVAKNILEQMGYTVKLQEADAGVVYAGLAKGDIDVFMDAWLPDTHKNYMDKYGNSIEDVAVSYPDGELGWVVPAYVEGITSIEDLKGKEATFDHTIYGIEEGAGIMQTTEAMIPAYGLDLKLLSSSEAGMLSQVKRAIDKKEPILFLGWRPHSMFAQWDLKVLDDPKGFMKTQEVHVVAHKGWNEVSPAAYAFFKNWHIDVGDVEQMILEIEDGKKPEDVTQAWIDAHQDAVQSMIQSK